MSGPSVEKRLLILLSDAVDDDDVAMEGLSGREAGWQIPSEDQSVGAAGNEGSAVVREANGVDGQVVASKQRQQLAR